MAATSRLAVLGAISTNALLCLLKTVAFVLSGSGAMLAEAVHSFADTANQMLLFLGIRRSERPEDARYPYGYGAERYLFALLSAVGIFVLGCGVSVYHGVRGLIDPHPLELSGLTFVVLAISLALEGSVLVVAIRAIQHGRKGRGFFEHVRTSSDPTAVAVLLEDSVACAGILVAAIGIWLSHITGSPVYDSLGSIVIGVMLGLVAVWLGWRNGVLILGPALPQQDLETILGMLHERPAVRGVRRARTRVLGAHSSLFAAEILFDGAILAERVLRTNPTLGSGTAPRDAAWARAFGAAVTEAIGAEVDAMEAEIRQAFPSIGHVEIEVDRATLPRPTAAGA